MTDTDNILDESSGGTETGLVISEQIKNDLMSISKWTKFLSILGFIGIGFMVIGALAITSLPQRGFNDVPKELITVIYLGMAVVYFFPILYLYKFSQNAKEGLNSGIQTSINEAFKYLNKHYRFIGIFTIVIISLYVLIFILAMLTATMR